jgi:preprotein translocase subunit YajC
MFLLFLSYFFNIKKEKKRKKEKKKEITSQKGTELSRVLTEGYHTIISLELGY